MPHLVLLALLSAAPPPTDEGKTQAAQAPTVAARVAVSPVPTLEQLLKSLADDELRKEARPACAYRERTRVEELHDDGTVKGHLVRTWAITRSASGALTRKLLSSEKHGELNELFTKEPKEPTAKERKAQRSPFHPEHQSQYRFKLVDVSSETLKLAFEPREPSDKRLRGTAQIDPTTHVLTSMSGAPSKLPPMTEQLELGLRYGSTACGVQPVRIRVKGAGGFLFFKARFRSETWHTEHRR